MEYSRSCLRGRHFTQGVKLPPSSPSWMSAWCLTGASRSLGHLGTQRCQVFGFSDHFDASRLSCTGDSEWVLRAQGLGPRRVLDTRSWPPDQHRQLGPCTSKKGAEVSQGGGWVPGFGGVSLGLGLAKECAYTLRRDTTVTDGNLLCRGRIPRGLPVKILLVAFHARSVL